jgi:hypothetical protein
MPDDVATVLDIVVACRRIARFISDLDQDSFLNDDRNQWAVVSQFTLIGEAASGFPQDFAINTPRYRGPKSWACETEWCTDMTRSIGLWCGQQRIGIFHHFCNC